MQGLRARVFINLNGTTQVYDQPFQYTPYAHYAVKATDADNATNATNAANGVPTGAIMPFMGTTAPAGWLMCDGSTIPSGMQYDALRTLMSTLPNAGKTPNLRGRFLRGAGTGGEHNAITTSQFDETTLGQYQDQSMQDHRHSDGDLITSSAGNHSHDVAVIHKEVDTNAPQRNSPSGRGNYYFVTGSTSYNPNLTAIRNSAGGATRILDGSGNEVRRQAFIQSSGNHTHNITGNTSNAIQASGAASSQPLFLRTEETKPYNFSVNFIIKI